MTECWLQTLGWCPTAAQHALFQRLYAGILDGNTRLNLTRIIDPKDFWEKHLWDSLSGLQPWLNSDASEVPQTILDIGTGGGFPGIPAAIAFPRSQVTLLDSTRKKITFLQHLCQQLGLDNVGAIADRAETLGQHPNHRAAYDHVLLRAVAPASVCAEYALPFLKPGGLAILYRGQWSDAETQSLQTALVTLGGTLKAVIPKHTPLSQSVRHCIQLQKIKPTPPQFPRAPGIPSQQPL